MTGTFRARLFWTLVVVLAAAASIVTRDVVLGLDLRGGATLRYELEPPATAQSTDMDELIASTVETLRRRIDTYGIKESSITRQGDREIVIELPGSAREDADAIRSVVARVGRLEWRIVAKDDVNNNMSVETEREKLAAFLEENEGRLPAELDLASLDVRFPGLVYRWVALSDAMLVRNRGLPEGTDVEEALAQVPLRPEDFLLIRMESARSRSFTGADIAELGTSPDKRGFTGIRIELDPSRAAEFGDFSEDNQGESIAIVLDGRVAQDPAVIRDRLQGSFIIESNSPGGFSEKEVKDYLTILRSGSLQMKPRLLFENVIGPTLGESSIASGKTAAIVGLLIVLAFMLVYYRGSGAIAAVSLLVNMVALAGALMLLGATITLPGVAGLVLTLGMAVDANILVFERMREEQEKGKDPGEVVKEGFGKAFSTIVDANVTTFVTALILYKLGTGPVRGFAVVLMLGILTSLFAVLIVSRLMYDFVLRRESTKGFSMGRLLPKDLAIGFMAKAKPMLTLSAVLVVASLVGFFASGRDKYGLDFLGGYKAQVRLSEPVPQGDVAERVASVFPGAQVVSVSEQGAALGDVSDRFMIKVKADPDADEDAEEDLQGRYERPLRDTLAGLLMPDGITDLQLDEDEAAQTTAVSATVHFTEPLDEADLAVAAENTAFLSGGETTRAGPAAVAVSGSLPGLGFDPALVTQRLYAALSGQDGLPDVNEPFVESTTIGSRVGTELRDRAIQAIVLALIAIVIYIRIRFREYRYGLAAVIALAHDVSITLGMVALARLTGLVAIEIDLAMIAAFLTIIGYSLNDTIVLFDRVRENLPRVNRPFPEVLDLSINQTLARTVLTSITTLLVLVVIFALNYGQGNVLEGFSFAMIVGVLVGTYSSIFVASPSLTMLSGGGRGAALVADAKKDAERKRKRASGSVPEGAAT